MSKPSPEFMWSKLASTMQEPAYKRLVFALCLSALLHFFLVGQFYRLLPEEKPELHTIEARLLMPKTVTKLAEVAKPAADLPAEVSTETDIPVKEPQQVEPEQLNEVKQTEAPSSADNTTLTKEPLPAVIVPTDETLPDPKLADPLATGDPIPTPPDAPVQPVDEGLVINENAYQYVETTFNVSTKIGGRPQGKATITYNLLDGVHYYINSVAKAGGLAALILSELVQTSEGVLTKNGLQPNKFTYNYGDKANKNRLASFDWQAKTVSMQTIAGTQIEPLQDDTQDLLSFMYQFMYVPPLHTMQIHIVNGKSLRTYDYSFEGENSIPLPIGEVSTIHIQHDNNETEEKIELWLAVDYQNLPVKIVKMDKNGKVYEFTATRINKVRPLADVSNKVDALNKTGADNKNANATP